MSGRLAAPPKKHSVNGKEEHTGVHVLTVVGIAPDKHPVELPAVSSEPEVVVLAQPQAFVRVVVHHRHRTRKKVDKLEGARRGDPEQPWERVRRRQSRKRVSLGVVPAW